MKTSSLFSLLAFLILTLVACATPANAQEFLNPIAVQNPTFLENGPVPPTTPPVNPVTSFGNYNNSSGLLTGPGAYNAGVVKGRQFTLPTAQAALMAPNSVNMAPFPSGSYSYGFTGSGAVAGAVNQYGMYGGNALPTVSTGSVDLNIVDCSNLAQNYGPGQVNPWGISNTLTVTLPDGTQQNINFQETAAQAQTFIQQEVQDSTPTDNPLSGMN